MVLIPAYQPSRVLVELVASILDAGRSAASFGSVVVVDDGSTREDSRRHLEQLSTLDGVEVRVHAANRGKGAALATGFAWVRDNFPDTDAVVCADADGQHHVEDIFRVAEQALAHGVSSLGVRDFGGRAPWRNKLGNRVSRLLFRCVSGQSIQDTQTGLRAIVRRDWDLALAIELPGYDYEFQMLFELVRRSPSELRQVPIRTIYEAGNSSSHFSPIFDSLRICFVLLRYMFRS